MENMLEEEGPASMPERESEDEEREECHIEQVLKAYALGSQDMALTELIDSLFSADRKEDKKEGEMNGSE